VHLGIPEKEQKKATAKKLVSWVEGNIGMIDRPTKTTMNAWKKDRVEEFARKFGTPETRYRKDEIITWILTHYRPTSKRLQIENA
jgi:hypothetical protein